MEPEFNVTPTNPDHREESNVITAEDPWQHLVFSMYCAYDVRRGDHRSPLQRVIDSAAKLFPTIEIADGAEHREEEWHRHVMGEFVSFLRKELGHLAPVT